MPDNGRVTDQPAAPEQDAAADADVDADVDATAPVEAPADAAQPTSSEAVGQPADGMTDEEWAAVAQDRSDRQKRRMRQNVRDMLLSLAVVGVVVLFFASPWNLLVAPDPVKEVEWVPVVTGAQEAYDWPVMVPVGLPASWRATSARIETADDGEPVVVVGWVTSSDEYLGLQQSPTRITDFVDTVTLDGVEAGTVDIRGTTWTRFVDEEQKRRSLVLVQDGVSYVVTGTGRWAEVEGFTARLRAT